MGCVCYPALRGADSAEHSTLTHSHTLTRIGERERKKERRAGDYSYLDVLVLHLVPWVSGVPILLPAPPSPLPPSHCPFNTPHSHNLLPSKPLQHSAVSTETHPGLSQHHCDVFFSNSRLYSSLGKLESRFGTS